MSTFHTRRHDKTKHGVHHHRPSHPSLQSIPHAFSLSLSSFCHRLQEAYEVIQPIASCPEDAPHLINLARTTRSLLPLPKPALPSPNPDTPPRALIRSTPPSEATSPSPSPHPQPSGEKYTLGNTSPVRITTWARWDRLDTYKYAISARDQTRRKGKSYRTSLTAAAMPREHKTLPYTEGRIL